jgi:membrane-associated phospholipid phosphatase
MLFGTGFLVAFPAAFSLLNYLLLTVAGPRIDWQLAAADRAIGFDWPSVMSVMANHPALNGVFRLGYNLVLPEFAVLILALGFNKRPEQIYRFCFALAAGAAITVAFWTVFPSFGAFSVYELDQATLSRLSLELDQSYARDLLRLLSNGPAWITPGDIKGLVGFPSFHAALALLLTWYIWPIRFLRWPAVFANSLVIVATPIQGGHHAVDVLAGFAVAAISIFATTAFESWVRRSGTGAAAGVLSGSLAAAE